jgi:hypothetical protein
LTDRPLRGLEPVARKSTSPTLKRKNRSITVVPTYTQETQSTFRF